MGGNWSLSEWRIVATGKADVKLITWLPNLRAWRASRPSTHNYFAARRRQPQHFAQLISRLLLRAFLFLCPLLHSSFSAAPLPRLLFTISSPLRSPFPPPISSQHHLLALCWGSSAFLCFRSSLFHADCLGLYRACSQLVTLSACRIHQ